MNRELRLRRAEKQIARWSPHIRRGVDSVELPEYVLGVDLRYQGDLDARRAIESGIVCYDPKWGQGDAECSTFRSYTQEALDAGGLVSWYHWPTIGARSGGGYAGRLYDPIVDGQNEAQALLSGLARYSLPNYPLAVDLEETYFPDGQPDRSQCRAFLRAYLGVLLPYHVGVFGREEIRLYSSARKLDEILGHYEEDPEFWRWLVAHAVLWLPRYPETGEAATDLIPDWAHPPKMPEQYTRLGRMQWVMWQFSSKARIDGIEKEADVSVIRTDWLDRYVPAAEIAAIVGRRRG